MPPGYPAPTVNGVDVSPASLRPELGAVTNGFPFAVLLRVDDRDRVGRELLELTHKHFAAARYLWAKTPWDLFVFHEIGPDRIHHAFWKFFEPNHLHYEDNPTSRAFAEHYYTMPDDEIARLLALVPPDVKVLIVSDHGSQAMQGCFCTNQWLIQRGYRVLKGPPPAPGTPLEKATVDWSKTCAWGPAGTSSDLPEHSREGVPIPDHVQGKPIPEFF